MEPEQQQPEPFLRVVRGELTPEETAALVAVIATRTAQSRAVAAAPRSAWRDRSRALRQPLSPGPGAWRASGRPR